MSTPERAQDPGEHGYGGTHQDYPGNEQDEPGTPTESGDEADDPREAPSPAEREETT